MRANCPECNNDVQLSDVRLGRCRHCHTKICIPNRYYRPASIGAAIFTIFVIAATGSLVWTSPAVFSHVMLWIAFIFITFLVSLFLCGWVWYFFSPPPVERIHANDVVTRLRLDD